jgi:hypothetical protein
MIQFTIGARSVAVRRRRQGRAGRAQLVALTLRLVGRPYEGEGATAEAADAALGERHYSMT